MWAIAVVVVSLLFQYAALIGAIRILRVTGTWSAWIFIVGVILLMALGRTVAFAQLLTTAQPPPLSLAQECLAMVISALLLAGVIRLGPMFVAMVRNERELKERTAELGKRIQELDCLHALGELLNRPDIRTDELLREAVTLLPSAMRYPERASARVVLDEQVYETAGFRPSPAAIREPLTVQGQERGRIEVHYAIEHGEPAEGLFLEQEQELLRTVGQRLGRAVAIEEAAEERARLQAQLYQAQKMEAVGLLAAGMAHDFNNLVTAILAHTDQIRQTHTCALECRGALEGIEEAAHQATEVTRSLLTFSSTMSTQKAPIDLAETLVQTARVLRRILPSLIDFRLSVPSGEPVWIVADKTQIQQMIFNLVVNARDAMPAGGRLELILASSGRTSSAGPLGAAGYAQLEVADSGHGIPPEVLPRIFDPFFTTKPRERGTGLGLSMVHGIVRDHGGQIEVFSEPGKGARFIIRLPQLPGPPATIDRDEAGGQVPQGHGQHILLAEDHAAIRRVITSLLRSCNYQVTAVGDGEAAWNACRSRKETFDLLVLDVDLPVRSGLEVLQALRREGYAAPAILISGNPTMDSAGMQSENVVLLMKPFRMAELGRVVSGMLSKKAKGAASLEAGGG